MDFLLSNLEFVVKGALGIFAGLLELFNLAVEELDLLSEQGLFTTRFKFQLHCLVLHFLELRPGSFKFLSDLSFLFVHLASRLVQICSLSRQSIRIPVQFMSQARNLLILLQALTHKLIDSSI